MVYHKPFAMLYRLNNSSYCLKPTYFNHTLFCFVVKCCNTLYYYYHYKYTWFSWSSPGFKDSEGTLLGTQIIMNNAFAPFVSRSLPPWYTIVVTDGWNKGGGYYDNTSNQLIRVYLQYFRLYIFRCYTRSNQPTRMNRDSDWRHILIDSI